MVIKLEVGMIETNCYILADEKTRAGIIIDPGDESAVILETVADNCIDVKYIIMTHGHWDHISALPEVKEKTKADILIHKNDENCLKDSTKNLSYVFGVSTPEMKADRLLDDGDEIILGDKIIKVIHTPGHTQGGICLLCDKFLFSGDTLFSGAIGRTDLPGGNQNQLVESIKKSLLDLDGNIKVYPGHGPSTTIARELERFNETWK